MVFSMSAKDNRVGIAHHGHDKPIGRADCDRHVEIIVIDDLVTVDLRIDRRHMSCTASATALVKKAHKAELHAVLLLEQALCRLSRASQ